MADDSSATRRTTTTPVHQTAIGGREPAPRMLAGRYELLSEIGSGATAVTYLGRDQRLDRHVAIKVMRRDHELDPNFVQRFEREARAAASVSHGNVVDVYDVGQGGGDLYIVMQYVDGDDLKHLIGRDGTLSPSWAIEIGRHVLSGLGAIHAAGIIHRDIKPQNVLVGRDGSARVTDFGIAQVALDTGLTTAGTTVGTAAYMAPEQAQGGQITEATDLYAVGVMLYEMLTGEMPFDAPTPMGLMLAHIQREPEPPSLRIGGERIPPALDGIVLQAMAKDPSDRFRSAAAMARALAGVDLSATSMRTTVLPSAAAARAVTGSAQPRAWSQAPAASAADRPVRLRPAAASSAGAGVRGALGGLLLLLLLAVAGVAGYVAYDVVTDDDGNGELPAVADSTATATDPSSEEAEPTEVPVVAPPETETETPDPTATSVPDPTATSVPTEEPTVPPTEEPTEPPIEPPAPTATSIPEEEDATEPVIEPVGAQDDTTGDGGDGEDPPTQQAGAAQVPNVIDTSQIQPVDSGQGGAASNAGPGSGDAGAGQSGTLDIGASDWKGGGSKYDKDLERVTVAPGDSATARFDVDALPTGDTFTIEIDMAVTGSGEVPLSFQLNGQELQSAAGTGFALEGAGSGNQLGVVTITVPTAPLVEGRNEITIVNGATGEGNGNGNGNDANLADNTLVLAGAVVTFDGS